MKNWTIAGHTCTDHAQKRMQQRGIKKQTIETILLHGDKSEHRGGNISSIFLSRKGGKRLIDNRGFSPALVERALNIIVLTGGRGIVTVYPRKHRSHRYCLAK